MAEGFLGEILMFGGNFAPRAWAFCDGQLLSIASNTALFSILGTTYGGDGRTTFALPDMRGRVPINPRHGAGLSDYRLGEKGGSETVSLTVSNLPSHNHGLLANNGAAASGAPGNALLAGADIYSAAGASANDPMNGKAIGNTGGSIPFNIRQPFLCVNFIIATQGIFPSRG